MSASRRLVRSADRVGILAASGIVERRHAPELILLGELSLDGSIHATRGSCYRRRGTARGADGHSASSRERR